MIVEPIGVVRSPRTEPVDDDWDAVVASISVDPVRFSPEAVAGLKEFSHIEVVYLFDRVDPKRAQTGARHPRGNPAWPEVGIFAQRAKGRPNRIGVSVCHLLDVDGLVLTVRALDAIDGTPVLDIKPYMTEFGPRGPVRQPAWSHELMAGYWSAASAPDPNDRLEATRRSYETVAERYAAELGDELAGKPLDRALLDALLETCPAGTVADIGCGPGHVGGYVAARGTGVIGVDLSTAMCSLALGDHQVPAVAADMTTLPIRSAGLSGVVCWYAVIHLDAVRRSKVYEELARVLRPGGHALVAFHTSDAEARPGTERPMSDWWDHDVELTFHFLEPAQEVEIARTAGLDLVARTDREPYDRHEHPSRRSYLLLRRR